MKKDPTAPKEGQRPGRGARPSFGLAPLAFVLLLLFGSGCHSLRNRDVVESQLRAREQDVRTLREELDRSEFHNRCLQRELRAVRGEPGPDGCSEPPGSVYPVRSLVLGRQTGGQPGESCGGDDALVVLAEPRDPEGQAIKAPGALHVEVAEITEEG